MLVSYNVRPHTSLMLAYACAVLLALVGGLIAALRLPTGFGLEWPVWLAYMSLPALYPPVAAAVFWRVRHSGDPIAEANGLSATVLPTALAVCAWMLLYWPTLSFLGIATSTVPGTVRHAAYVFFFLRCGLGPLLGAGTWHLLWHLQLRPAGDGSDHSGS